MSFLAFLASIALIATTPDVAPSSVRTHESARNYTCEYLSITETERRFPGAVAPTPGRGDSAERNSLVCTESLIEAWRRNPQDEAILRHLTEHSREMAETATSIRPDLAGRTWLVEAYHPNAVVTAKLAFASKNALMEQGVTVSDRTPLLAVGDVDALVRLPATEAYREACARYTATGSLKPTDALLAVVYADPRETSVHAGVCERGTWSWL